MTVQLNALIELQEAADYCRVAVETLSGWTASGHAPHYFVDGKGPLYMKGEIRTWVEENLVHHNAGMPIPRRVDVLCRPSLLPAKAAPPAAVSAIESLCLLSTSGMRSGIYFLCDGPEVVYVGQSTTIVARVASHMNEGAKTFDHDRVFFLPCPARDLNELERHYIVALQPKYNRTSLKALPEPVEKPLALPAAVG